MLSDDEKRIARAPGLGAKTARKVILELKDNAKRYTMKDRFSVRKSKEMFVLYQSFYNPKNNVEQAIRSWNV